MDYALWQIIAILGTYLLAASAKGLTGLGFSTTCLPFLTLIVGLKEALPLVIIPSISSNLVVMYGAGQFRETVARFWPMLLATVPGLALGLSALAMVDGVQAGAVLGLMMLLWCAFSFATPNLRLPAGLERPLAPISGLLTGTVNGLTGSQVMPSVPFLMSLGLTRNMFIQAVNCSFTLSSLIMAVGLNRLGLFTSDALILSIIGTGLIVFGLRFGERIRDRLPPEAFRRLILLVLSVMGLSLILQAI